MSEKEQKEFTFMNEQFKKKPFYKKKGFLKAISVGALAIVFGAAAGLTFSIIQPWAQKQFGEPEEPAQIVVVQEETQAETERETAGTEQEETEQEETEQVIEKKELEIADYKMLYNKMSDVAENAKESLVTVTGESSNLDWFDEVIESHVQTSGLVIAQGKREYYVLTELQPLQGAEKIIITFQDGNIAEGILQHQDASTGLAMLKVMKDAVRVETRAGIKVAQLCTDSSVKQGEPVIALSSPIGNNPSMSFGMITTVTQTPVTDAQYRILQTDILGSEEGSGVLVNLDGKIVGIIAQEFSSSGDQITQTAIACSDMQELIRVLVNHQVRPYLGITGKEIDETISREFDMPRGIYVRSVEEESPAMYANVIVADIITTIDGKEIYTLEDYARELKKCRPQQSIRLGIKRSAMDGYVDMEISITLGHT